ncbi:GTP-binding protein [Peptoniphilus sp. oral taxon 386]|uniref:GTP-binding protein n=1 Tax=Peptoniphilus sp. oral taxon 386 TaxID=652713 RepID=UPI0001DA9992|nr:GTP-binding protein [Peptoniphilus sp. oral taxon 386]EFI41428.1 CobW/P47K family protein [Peptoniphilus sp. oral taxon 386 str. F0131]
MKILLISGFLGSGKTSFIKAMSKATKRQFVIVENEFGDMGIDGEILKSDTLNSKNTDMKIWELSEGCICCSLNLDFTHSVLTIANTLNPDYLIVEPSGVAFPSKIISQLRKICYERIELLPLITIIDAYHYKNSKKDFPDYFYDQLNNASSIILSKSESMDYNNFLSIKNELNIDDKTFFPTTHYSKWSEDIWFNLLNGNIDYTRENKISNIEITKEQQLDNISITNIGITNPATLTIALSILISGTLGKIVRAKGYFKAGRDWIKFDLVDGSYAITGCTPMPDNRVVVIGNNLNKSSIKMLFENKVIKKLKNISAIKSKNLSIKNRR